MTRRFLLLACAAATVASTTGAQGQATELDSASAVYRDTLLGLRDQVTAVRGEVGRFRRDLQLVGGRTVIGRAERLHGACEDLRVRLSGTQSMFRPSRVPQEARDAARSVVQQTDELQRALRVHCTDGLAPSGPGERADSLKAWGPFHASQLERRLVAYGHASATLAKAMGFRIEPRRP